jgi:PPM family protein phosphatase
MTLALRYAVRSDVGLLREGNEDSAYAGPRLLAVADGMGGHAAGEVASAVAISALARLDENLPGADLLEALSAAVRGANQTLHEMVADNPALDGMGTTLTAMLWSPPKLALCHIGDSRAYLLRDGELYQITHDHTLVQKLQDEGRISPDEAATHPQRSLILRALDGRTEAEPDLSLREAVAGDRYLLCSDGLSSVVSAETLHRTLTVVGQPDQAVIQLVELANRGGGPDNITCIVADVVDSASSRLTLTDVPVLAGAASNGRSQQATLPRPDTPAGRANALTRTTAQGTLTGMNPVDAGNGRQATTDRDSGEDEEDDEEDDRAGLRSRRRWPIVTGLLVVLLAVVVGAGFAAWNYAQNQYYVAADRGRVVIFRGLNEKVAGFSLSSVFQRTGIALAEVPQDYRARVAATITASSLPDARSIVGRISQEVQVCRSAEATLARWKYLVAHLPKPVKGKRPPVVPPQPVVPPNCPSAAGGVAGAQPSVTPSAATPTAKATP